MKRGPLRNFLVWSGLALVGVAGFYLGAGLAGLVPLQMEAVAWNNIRIVSAMFIVGCLMAAVGYGNEPLETRQ